MNVIVNVVPVDNEKIPNIKANVSIIFRCPELGDFSIYQCSLVENSTDKNLFLSLPQQKSNKKDKDGNPQYYAICKLSKEWRDEIQSQALAKYSEKVLKQPTGQGA